jgi:hypothetical protein
VKCQHFEHSDTLRPDEERNACRQIEGASGGVSEGLVCAVAEIRRAAHSTQKRAYLLVHQSVTVKITVRFPLAFPSVKGRRSSEKTAKVGAFLPLSVAFRAFYALY